jgi:ribosomal protein S18 acetylase RimI-like enzyme
MTDTPKGIDNPVENKSITISTKTISGEQLIDLIYKGKSLPQDSRYLSFEKGGVFKYFDLAELSGLRDTNNLFYSLIEVDNKIVGLSELEKQPGNETNLWIKFISVDPQFQNRGYASKLAEEIFSFAKNNGFSLEESMRSPEGELKLKPKLRTLAQKYLVTFKERN